MALKKEEIKSRIPGEKYYPTGFGQLDTELGGGLIQNALHVFAGNPFHEVYSVLLSVINHFSKCGTSSVFMAIAGANTVSRVERELLANSINIPVTSLDRTDELTTTQINKLEADIKNLGNVEVVTPSYRNMDHIEEMIDKYCNEGKKVFFIDSLQNLLIGPFERKYAANFEQEFSSNCKRLCDIIRSRAITVVALSLLNKDIDRDNKPGPRYTTRPPLLVDLRDSNVLAQSAYNIIFLHRPQFYNQGPYYDPSEEEINSPYLFVARNGNKAGQNSCILEYNGSTGFFVEGEPPAKPSRHPYWKDDDQNDAKIFIRNGSKMNDMNFDDEGLGDAPF